MTSTSGELKAAKIASESSGGCQRVRHDATSNVYHTVAPQAARTNARVCVYDKLDRLSTRHAKGLHPLVKPALGYMVASVRIADIRCSRSL